MNIKSTRAKSSAISRISLFMHVLWGVVFGYILGVNLDLWPRVECINCENESDPIAVAAQLGRLDMVAMALAVLGVTLAVAALISFQVVRAAAMDAARDEARDRLEDMLPKLLTAAMIADALRKNQPIYLSIVGQIRETIGLQGASDIKDSDADSIAEAAGNETGAT